MRGLICGLCGNPLSMHRGENVAHHSECTLETFVVRPEDRRECPVSHVCRNANTYLCEMCRAERAERVRREKLKRKS